MQESSVNMTHLAIPKLPRGSFSLNFQIKRSPLGIVRNLLLRSHVELLLLRPRPRREGGWRGWRHGGTVGPPAVGGAVPRAVRARRARPRANGRALLQLEHRLAAVGLGSLKKHNSSAFIFCCGERQSYYAFPPINSHLTEFRQISGQ